MYLYNSLKNKSIDLFRKYVLKKKEEIHIDFDFPSYAENYEIKILVNDLLNLDILSERHKTILKQSYLYDYSDAEIAKSLNISRQAVHKQKKHGLTILKNYLGDDFSI